MAKIVQQLVGKSDPGSILYSRNAAFGYTLDPYHIYRNKHSQVIVASFYDNKKPKQTGVLVVYPDGSKWFTKDHSIESMVQRFM